MVKAPAIGIDLGTTYSCVAVFQHGKVEIIANDQGNRTTPSQVAFTETERLIGEAAVIQAAMNPENTVFDAKRLIGRRFNDPCVQSDMKHWPFKVVDELGRPKIQVQFREKEKKLHPEEISAMVLKKMRESAEAYLGQPVQDAVITVPAYFNVRQREDTRIAGGVAGLNVLRIISEPTAAALAYGLDKRKAISTQKNVLIFDLGGGTFDVSILSIQNGVLEVKATAGDTHLGGEDFDNRMVNHFVEEFCRKHDKDISDNAGALRRLRTACERAKRALSSSTKAAVGVDSLYEGIHFYSTITRARFEELCSDLFRATLGAVDRALKDAEMDKSKIHDIVVVGGSTRIPKIQKLLQDFFNGKELNKSIHPDEAVAYGAAIQAAILNGDQSGVVKDLLLVDVTPLSLGLGLYHGGTCTVIKRNSKIPCKFTKTTFTVAENQTTVVLTIFQGERVMANDNFELGSFALTGLAPLPKGKLKFEVTFEIDADGILKVSAVDTHSGKRNQITITKGEGSLSTTEIERMIIEAEMYRDEDEKIKRKIAARNALEDLCYSLKQELGTDHARIEDRVSESERDSVLRQVTETLRLLEVNELADTEEYENKQNDLQASYDSVISKI